MFRALLFNCCLFYVCVTTSSTFMHSPSDEFIEEINSKQNLWTAGHNFHKDTPVTYLYRLVGTYKDPHLNRLPQRNYTYLKRKYPKNFDARTQWPHCPTLNDIRDQGSCGSCWATAAVSAMTDRVCIKSKGKKNFYVSAEDLLSCCDHCGKGCFGGKLAAAWQYYKHDGLVSGGSYNSSQGCKPYEIPPCEHENLGEREKCGADVRTPKCTKKCNKNYKIEYNKDKHRGISVYTVKTSKNIMKEMYKNGPVTSYFEVFQDFYFYKSGIYKHTVGNYVGCHSVKLIGWGEDHEHGVKYWIAANSWNTDWGENGFFKIIRDDPVGGCGMEDHIVAGK